MGSESTVAALVRSALSSDVVSTAAIARHWRETYVAAPVGGALSEATGRDETRRQLTGATLLFLDPTGATSHQIVKLEAAMTELRKIIDEVAAGH